jgi:general secretion pathway protein I
MSVALPEEAGFTLVEMLVALSILSLAGLAVLKLSGATAISAARLEEQAIAQIVARNLAVEAMSDPVAPPYGESAGEVVNGGRHWRWARRTARSPESRIKQIHIRVTGSQTSAALIVFRRAAA